MAGTGSQITRYYGEFRGLDLRGAECNLNRSPDALNVWRNYKNLAAIETRPSMQTIWADVNVGFHPSIYPLNILFLGETLFMIANNGIYKLVDGSIQRLGDPISSFHPINYYYVFNDSLYFFNKNGLYKVNETSNMYIYADAYVPTTSIGRKPEGGGQTHEDVNLISGYRINTFIGDGTSTKYYLDSTNIDDIAEVYVNDEELFDYTYSEAEGSVTFAEAPPKPGTDGQDNVSIKYYKNVHSNADNPIINCTVATIFDNRIFVSGNPQYPNRVWHSSLNNATYFSDLDYYDDGTEKAKVRALVPGNNALWVLKEPSDSGDSIYYHMPTLDETYGKIYPSSHSSVSLGCVGKGVNFNDDIMFASESGFVGMNGDVTTEQAVAHRSSLVDRVLTANPKYKDMTLVEWQGYLLVFIDNECYLADSRAVLQNENHLEYEWYHWEFDYVITCVAVKNDVLYLGTLDGRICTLTGDGAVNSYWCTPKDKFSAPNMVKSTNKKSFVVEAEGDVDISIKTNNDQEFQPIASYSDIKDHIVCKLKAKKFKDLQIKFASNTRFRLESVTLEAIVGGYLK